MRLFHLMTSTFLLALTSACGGAGSGDSNVIPPDNVAMAAVAPLVGVWDLPDNWNDRSGDEAYLVIRTPNEQGVAEAIIYDLDDAIPGAERGCYLIDGGQGSVSQSLTNLLFLDVPYYPSAIVVLQPNGQLQISVYAEGAGVTSDLPPEKTLTAERFTGIAEASLTTC